MIKYSETSRVLWQYCRDEPALSDSNNNIANFGEDNATTNSFKIKEKITAQIRNNGRKDVEIMVPLKYLSNFVELLRCL